MQIIILGMHRSGTSVVARLLNMMGAYFAPDEVMMQPTTANPKGYWEREDIRVLNDDIFNSLETSWDNINDFDVSLLTDEVQKEFAPRVQKIIFNLDAHRPWMVKDPRLCLLLPVWRSLLEVPVCIYVYRNPIQVAQSLQTREGLLAVNEGATLYSTRMAGYLTNEIKFPIILGMALWEKYTLNALANSEGLPRILVSFHDLMSNPVDTIKTLYQNLLSYEVQGLRLPSDREILAYIEPKFFHEHGDNELQKAYINTQQSHLVKAFQKGNILELHPLPNLSTGASEVLEEYQNKLLAADKILACQQDIARRDAEVVKRDVEIAKRDEEIAKRDAEIAKRDEKIAKRDAQIANHQEHIAHLEKHVENLTLTLQAETQERIKYQQQASNYQSQWLAAEQRATNFKQENTELNNKLKNSVDTSQTELAAKEHELAAKEHEISEQSQQIATLTSQLKYQDQNVHKLTHWVFALDEDITAAFNSLTWRSGRIFSRIALALMFKKAGMTAEDHIKEITEAARAWKLSAFQADEHAVAGYHTITKTPVPMLTTLKRVALQHDSRDYQQWIKNYDTLTPKMVSQMQQQIQQWNFQPLISIVMPTYNTEDKWLRAAIESVQQQIYPNWELCIADDASTQPQVRRILEEYAHNDQRIKLKFRTENGHISAASNSALEITSGEFVTFLDHDDMLARHALFWVAQAIIDSPDTMLWYSDEDKINSKGERCDPYFKPAWNPDLFLSHNFITHLIIYRTEFVKQVGSFRGGYEGAQDYDLALRVIGQITPEQIHHIPRVLYHWRVTSGSTALHLTEKPYAITAAKKAISEYFAQQSINAHVMESSLLAGAIRVQYQLPASPPLVTLIIPTYNAVDLLRRCVESVLSNTDYPNFEILIVNNNSDDPITLAYLQKLEDNGQAQILDYPHPFNYPALNNTAVQHAQSELICLLNNDIEVISPGWLTEMVSHAVRPGIGAVGARLWYPDDRLQHGGVIVGLGGIAGHSHKYLPRHHVGYFGRIALIQNLSAVTAACMVLRKETYLAVNGLDGENLSVAFNDVDFCLRIKESGLRILWTPYAELYHHESASRGEESTPEKIVRFQQECSYMKSRWGESLLKDPAYSPNLTLDTEDFAYAWPPRVSSIAPS